MSIRRQRHRLGLLCALLVVSMLLIAAAPGPGAGKGPAAPGPGAGKGLGAPRQARAAAVSTNEVDVTWRAPAAGNVAGYVIRRDGEDLATVDSATLNYADLSVQPSTKYSYTVVTVDPSSKRSAESRRAHVKTPAPPELQDTLPPSEPEGFTATAKESGGVLLDWEEGGTDDSDIGGYRIYRDGQLLATLDAGALSYLDETAVPRRTYTYEIESLDIVGHHSEREEASAAALKRPTVTEDTETEAPETTSVTREANVTSEAGVTSAAAITGVAPELKRYPYLTDVVDKYVTINWGTDRSAITGSATWGEVQADGTCNPTNSVAGTRTAITVNSVSEYQWKATLTLAPNKEYCYRVFLKAVDLLGSDPSPRFRTQLPAGSTEPFSFVVFGDWGNTNSDAANPDEAAVMQQIANSGARFAMTVGDNAYSSGSQTNYGDLYETGPNISAVFGPEFWAGPGRSMPIFPATGNHGYGSTTSAHPELTNFPQDMAVALSGGKYERETYCCLNGTLSESYPSAWYAFDAGVARFYVLSAAWADNNVGTADLYKNDYDSHWTVSSAEYQWLENDLATHPSALKFAFFHFPMHSDNTAQTTDTYLQGSESLEGLLGRYGVSIAFNGHAHAYQRTIQNADGLVTYLTGGGGAKLATVRDCKPNDAYALGWSFASNEGTACGAAPVPTSPDQVYHFLKVSVDGTTVTVTPTDERGRTFDVQTYNFGSGGGADTEVPTAPTGLTATASSSSQVDLSWTASTDNVGVTGYDIYRNGALLQSVGVTTSFSDTTVAPSTDYSYAVKAKDAAGNVSPDSNTATVTTPGSGGSTALTFVPVADAYVEQAKPTTNFGTATKLLVDVSPIRESYLRFTVSGLSGSVQNATLRLFVTDHTPNGPGVYGVPNTSWSETGLTWDNKPTHATTATDNKGAVVAGAWVEYDVTPLVTGNGTFSFALIGDSSDGMDVYSREGAEPPQLVVTAGSGGGGSDTQVPTAPTGLTATAASSSQVNLSWTASTDNVGVTGYDIYRNGALLQSVGVTTSFSDTTVAASTSYSYTVKATDAAGNISPGSNVATVTTPGDGTSTTQTFTPAADAYVEEVNPGTNFGTATKVLVDKSPVREGYLRFAVSGLSGSVQSATLRLFVTDHTPNGPGVYGVADTTWSETGITWNTKPAHATTATDNKGAVAAGAWVEYDVTPLVTGNGSFGFALIGDSSDGMDVYSREGAEPPQLVVTTETSP